MVRNPVDAIPYVQKIPHAKTVVGRATLPQQTPMRLTPKLFIQGLVGTFLLATGIALFISANNPAPLIRIWGVSLIVTFTIVSCAFGGSYGSYLVLGKNDLHQKVFVYMPISLLFTAIGVWLAGVLASSLYPEDIPTAWLFFKNYAVVSALTAVVSAPYFVRALGVEKATSDVLTLKSEGKIFRVPIPDILYLTSQRNNTLVYTGEREYQANEALKTILERLPQPKFIRVHKSHVLNIEKLSHIEYNVGGSYLAYLYGDDNLTIPVGRKYAPVVKERLSE